MNYMRISREKWAVREWSQNGKNPREQTTQSDKRGHHLPRSQGLQLPMKPRGISCP
jgi:hypothetical protein